MPCAWDCFVFFSFNVTAPTEIYTLSLHDALPISSAYPLITHGLAGEGVGQEKGYSGEIIYQYPYCSSVLTDLCLRAVPTVDRKSTRLNSSHVRISYAVFCLKKKKIQILCPHFVST